MYTIWYDGAVLYDPRDESRDIRDAAARIAVADAGSFEIGDLSFTIDAGHPELDRLKRMSGIVELRQDDAPVFRGRIARDRTDIDLAHKVEVESCLTFLNDSVVDPFGFPADVAALTAYQTAAASGNVVAYYLGMLLAAHNGQVSSEQKLQLGRVTVTDPNNYIARESKNHETTFDVVRDLVESLGGYLVPRYDEDVTYLDYLAALTDVNSQKVEWSKNLVDVEREIDGTEMYNEILPVGADGLTISSLPDGPITVDLYKQGDRIYSHNGRARFRHRITRIAEWSDVTTAASLQAKAAADLEAHSGGSAAESITCKAVDLGYTSRDIEKFRAGRTTFVRSDPHGIIDEAYPLTEINVPDMKDPGSTEITLGRTTATISAAVSAK